MQLDFPRRAVQPARQLEERRHARGVVVGSGRPAIGIVMGADHKNRSVRRRARQDDGDVLDYRGFFGQIVDRQGIGPHPGLIAEASQLLLDVAGARGQRLGMLHAAHPDLAGQLVHVTREAGAGRRHRLDGTRGEKNGRQEQGKDFQHKKPEGGVNWRRWYRPLTRPRLLLV